MSPETDEKFRVILKTSIKVNGTWSEMRPQVISLRPDYRCSIMIVHTANRLAEDDEVSDAERTRVLTELEYVPSQLQRQNQAY